MALVFVLTTATPQSDNFVAASRSRRAPKVGIWAGRLGFGFLRAGSELVCGSEFDVRLRGEGQGVRLIFNSRPAGHKTYMFLVLRVA